tara:strand:+ start:1246 stop:1725 length:480 start_codon:yes stop_codon:yes gene_type:complete
MFILSNLLLGTVLGTLAVIQRGFLRLFSTLRRVPVNFTSEQLGQQAEKLAARFFMRRGYSVLGHRVETGLAEIDLVLVNHWLKDLELVIVEVKASRLHASRPHRRLTPRKRQRVWLAGQSFQRQHHLHDVPLRMELVTVVWPRPSQKPQLRRFRVADEN